MEGHFHSPRRFTCPPARLGLEPSGNPGAGMGGGMSGHRAGADQGSRRNPCATGKGYSARVPQKDRNNLEAANPPRSGEPRLGPAIPTAPERPSVRSSQSRAQAPDSPRALSSGRALRTAASRSPTMPSAAGDIEARGGWPRPTNRRGARSQQTGWRTNGSRPTSSSPRRPACRWPRGPQRDRHQGAVLLPWRWTQTPSSGVPTPPPPNGGCCFQAFDATFPGAPYGVLVEPSQQPVYK